MRTARRQRLDADAVQSSGAACATALFLSPVLKLTASQCELQFVGQQWTAVDSRRMRVCGGLCVCVA